MVAALRNHEIPITAANPRTAVVRHYCGETRQTLRSKEEREANIKSKCYIWILASGILLVLSGQVLARRINHDVTPANIGKMPFSATVKVKEVTKRKELEIAIKDVKGNLFRPSSPGGWLEIPNSGKPSVVPAVRRVEKDGTVSFTFQLAVEEVEGARFGFVEDAEDWNRPFPAKGDYYQFLLKEFKGNSREWPKGRTGGTK